jgi:hypothetical protein
MPATGSAASIFIVAPAPSRRPRRRLDVIATLHQTSLRSTHFTGHTTDGMDGSSFSNTADGR